MEKISFKEKSPRIKSLNEVISEIIDRINHKSVLIIDIDGVLINIDIKVFLRGLILYMFSKKQFRNFLKEYKIPTSFLLKIKRIRKKGADVILLTSRFQTKDKSYFPFISQETIERFQKSDIFIIPYPKFSFGIVELPEKIINKIKNKSEIFYIGSGKLDELIFKKLAGQFKDKKFEYFQVGQGNRLI